MKTYLNRLAFEEKENRFNSKLYHENFIEHASF
jgi:hypothetical protein